MMTYLLRNIKIGLNEEQDFIDLIAKKMKLGKGQIQEYQIYKKSIDARKKDAIILNYSFVVKTDARVRLNNDLVEFELKDTLEIVSGDEELGARPIVVGAGPAGLFCAYVMALNGYRPLVIERGQRVEDRIRTVESFFAGGSLDVNSNIQFGEGGAGTFSDGKLNTGINDPKCNFVLNTFVQFGAPEEIKYHALPHVGTDKLREIIPKIRKEIEKLGGEFLFQTTVTEVLFDRKGAVTGCVINNSEHIDAKCIIMAIGHSARDTFEMLLEKGLVIEQKPFSVGARIEHKQQFLDEAQYGKHAGNPKLGRATYKLFTRDEEPTAYTFCMCPGGKVVAAASEENTIVTNGMSEYARNEENCNAALVVAVDRKDFDSDHPLAGVEFQRKLERRAYEVGGGCAPVQTVKSFFDGKRDTRLGEVKPSYPRGTSLEDLNTVLPAQITRRMKNAIETFDKKIRGYASAEALLTGVETRTSSPVRIIRNEELQAVGHQGLYLSGEGPGYAGGIMSAAVDGVKTAIKIIERYRKMM